MNTQKPDPNYIPPASKKQNHFVDLVTTHEEHFTDPAEILNIYRNFYFRETESTERKIIADALNMVLPELARLRKEHAE